MAYYLSGAIRQVLANSTEGVGEYGNFVESVVGVYKKVIAVKNDIHQA